MNFGGSRLAVLFDEVQVMSGSSLGAGEVGPGLRGVDFISLMMG